MQTRRARAEESNQHDDDATAGGLSSCCIAKSAYMRLPHGRAGSERSETDLQWTLFQCLPSIFHR
jgi:hypothetical protein